MQTSTACVVSNGRLAEPCPLSSERWLCTAPRGAYTTARTVGQARVFELSFHIHRLAESACLMIGAERQENGRRGEDCRRDSFLEYDTLRPTVLESLRSAINAYRQAHPSWQGELKLTVLLSWQSDAAEVEVWTHAAPLPLPPQPPVKVQVYGQARSNAGAKDSQWVRERQALLDRKPPDVNEVLLVDEHGCIEEGMSSNLFAVEEGGLLTAEEGVLKGSVRRVVLQVCAQAGIPVQLRAPHVGHISHWRGAFLTSTSRLVLPIDQLDVVEGPHAGTTRSFRADPLVTKVKELVMAQVAACSEAVDVGG